MASAGIQLLCLPAKFLLLVPHCIGGGELVAVERDASDGHSRWASYCWEVLNNITLCRASPLCGWRGGCYEPGVASVLIHVP